MTQIFPVSGPPPSGFFSNNKGIPVSNMTSLVSVDSVLNNDACKNSNVATQLNYCLDFKETSQENKSGNYQFVNSVEVLIENEGIGQISDVDINEQALPISENCLNYENFEFQSENGDKNCESIHDKSLQLEENSATSSHLESEVDTELEQICLCNLSATGCKSFVGEVNISLAIIKNKVTVPPRQKILVELTSLRENLNSLNNNVILEPIARKFNDGVLASRAVCSQSHGLFMSLINFTDQPVTFNKGMRVAKILKCKEEENSDSGEDSQFCGNLDIQPQIASFDHADLTWSSEINLDHLDERNKLIMQKFLAENRDVFASSVLDLPGCDTIMHDINLNDNKPVRCKAYRVPYNLRKEMDEQLDTLLKANIISPSVSEFSSPVLLVKKADGSYRLAVDYRKLNKQLIKDAYPIPNITDSVDALSGSKFFSTLDLTSGFFQQLINPKDQYKTAIITHKGLFQWVRSPFGLSSSPNSFQRLMNAIFGDLGSLGILVYIDDIVVASKDLESHLEKLKTVFDRLRQHKLKLKPSKCTFLATTIKYLGFQIQDGKVSPINKNIEVIQNFKSPQSRKAVRSFIGTISFYRRFVPDFSKRAKHLINLTKENGKFAWSQEAQAEFEDLKAALVSKPCLALPDFSKPFYLYTDASGEALGAVLSQLDEENFPHPVAFASRKLKDAETRYSATERELLALVWATAHFKCYLANVHFTIFTDHAPLTFMLKINDPTSRMAKWICTLSDFDIKYIKGKCNSVADFLSRFVNNSCNLVNINSNVNFCMQQQSVVFPHSDIIEKIKLLQKSDRKCIGIVKKLNSGKKLSPKHLKFFLHEDILVCKDTRESPVLNQSFKLVVPMTLVEQVFALTHDSLAACHQGVHKTLERIREHFYWSGMTAHVKNLVESCVSCQQRRAHKAKQLAPLQRMNTPDSPMSTVHSDCIGPLPLTFQGNRYIVTYVDAFSKWPEAYAVPSITSDVIAETLSDFVSRYGSPSKLITDRGSNYLSKAMEKVYKNFGIHHIKTTAYHPSSDGKAERLNRSLIEALSHVVDKNQQDWDTKLKFALLALRTAVHSSTKLTPAAVMYGRNLNLPFALFNYTPQINYNDAPSYCELLIPALQKIYSEVYQNLVNVSETQEKYREKTAVIKNIKVGDLVWLNNPAVKKGQVRKLAKLNEGAYTVIRKLNDVNYEIAMENDLSKLQTVHVDRLTLARHRLKFPSTDVNLCENVNNPQIPTPESSNSAPPENEHHNPFLNVNKRRKRTKLWGWLGDSVVSVPKESTTTEYQNVETATPFMPTHDSNQVIHSQEVENEPAQYSTNQPSEPVSKQTSPQPSPGQRNVNKRRKRSRVPHPTPKFAYSLRSKGKSN